MSRSPYSRKTIQRRIEDLAVFIANRQFPAAEGSAACVGQVYDGGHLSTQPGRYVLTNPIRSIGGSEVEGSTPGLPTDPTESRPVLVLGGPPRVGDILVAR